MKTTSKCNEPLERTELTRKGIVKSVLMLGWKVIERNTLN